ncbi:MAG: leucine-rich repeat domain-containing protein [Tannerellaceae bacterium]|jgi:hypothetical protein|nr:leucine-rich repeat domain-containing protein [Tannerellaceae bacterium]
MNTKRHITFFSLLAASLLALNAYAVDFADKFSYETTSDTTVTLTGLNLNIYYDLVVPDTLLSEGKRYEVTRIGKGAFAANGLIESVKMGKYVTMIEDSAFTDCTSLKTVTFSQSVDSIGNWAFGGCTQLAAIDLPSQLAWMGERAFLNCDSLKSVVVPDKVTRLSGGLFGGCKGLTSVTLPDGLLAIDSAAFGGCAKLTAITIPKKVERISGLLFSRTGLTTITIPAGVKEMDINPNPFQGCTKLESINVEGGNRILSSIDGVLFSKDKATLIAWPQAKANKDYTVPNETKTIGNNAFYSAENLTSITLPEGVTTVGESAFNSAKNLTSVTLPESITDLGENAFAYTRIQSIVIPDKVTELKDGVFAYTYLTDITLGKQIAVIHDKAFEYSYDINCMYIAATTPPLYNGYVSRITLYVPKGTYDAYYAVFPWRNVSEIIESDSVVRFCPISYTIDGGYPFISLTNLSNGYSVDRNFMSVVPGDSVRMRVKDEAPHYASPVRLLLVNGVDMTNKNEALEGYYFIYTAKADGPIHFYISFLHPVGIQSPEIKQTNVYTSAQNIIIRATENNLPVFIYDMMGRLVHRSVIQEGDKYIPVRPGLYIVKVKDKTEKVVVRK